MRLDESCPIDIGVMEVPNVENSSTVDVPDTLMDELLIVLKVYITDLKSALDSKDVEKIRHHCALVRDKIDSIEAQSKSALSIDMQKRTHAELLSAKNERDLAERLLALVYDVCKNSAPSNSTSSHRSRVRWNWTAVPFHGKASEWATWWDVFNTSIHSQSDLEPEWKMKSLNECLHGAAREALGKMAMTGENYQEAIRLLQERFADPLLLSRNYYDELAALAPANSLKEHRKVLDKLNSIVRNLESLKEKIPIDHQAIVHQIMVKFPNEILRWALHSIRLRKPDMIYGPSDLLHELDQALRIDDIIAIHRGESSNSSSDARAPAAGVLNISRKRSSSRARDSRTCIYCGLLHTSADCRKFPTLSSRRTQLTNEKRCFNCLKQHHEASKCRAPPAVCERCQKSHNTVLCVVKVDKKSKQGMPYNISGSFLQTFICTLLHANNHSTLEIRGLFDTGSIQSFINFDVVKKLQLPLGRRVSLDYLRFGDPDVNHASGYEVIVRVLNSENTCRSYRLTTTPCVSGDLLTSPSPSVVTNILPNSLNYADYDIFQDNPRPIKLLIGADIYHDLVEVKKCRDLPCGVRLLHSFFGWFPSGSILSYEEPQILAKKYCSSLTISALQSQQSSKLTSNSDIYGLLSPHDNSISSYHLCNDVNLEHLWSLEVLGIENPQKQSSQEYALNNFRKTSFQEASGRMNVRLPWKDTKTDLPSNFRVALARLRQLVAKTPKDVLQMIDEHFSQQIKNGILENASPVTKVSRVHSSDEISRLHYLPHRWLLQKNKLRIVYDASAKTKTGHSLNDLIYQGFNLTKNLVQLCLNFRLFAIALVADIEKAYLQISLNEVDRDATRSLWPKDFNKAITSDNLHYLRFARVPFGINASPFLLNMVLQELFTTPPSNKFLLHGQDKFYVDNLVTSVQNPADALELFETMTNRLESIKMNLRDWATNEQSVASALPPAKLDSSSADISVLGMKWNRETDSLSLKLSEETPTEATKRNVLKFLASIFDPLGLVSPCILDLKILVQKCWKNKYQWNTKLPSQLQHEWLKLRNDALQIQNISIPRRYWTYNGPAEYYLHVFCDASQKAYACCAYVVHINKINSEFASQLVFSKTRIAPINPLTIPKLELMAVVIGKRTASFLKNSLSIRLAQITIWTDATTILQWLNSTEVLPPFIKNRISEIKCANDVSIRYVPTTDNPADFASRGKSAAQIDNCTLWWKGPTWLSHERLWPKPPINVDNFQTSTLNITSATFLIGKFTKNSLLTEGIEQNLKSWIGRVRAFYYLIKFCFLGSKLPFHASQAEAMVMAEKLLIIELQRKYFHKEYHILKKGGNPLNNLDLFLDENKVIRCRGRLLFARFPWETTHPILLPRESPATFSYIKDLHEQNAHIGVSHTLAKVRERFWIVKGRAKVRSVIHKCFRCRFWEGGHYRLPAIPPLPEARVHDVTPFLQVGVDYFGPLHIKNASNSTLDVYILILACLVTRAIHLELVPDLSGEHFIMALDRFCSLRRVPKLIISDNATTFTFVQPLVGIKVNITDHKVNKMLNTNRIEWYFIPQYAPWFGGAYERLIGLVKRCLKKSYGKVLLNYIELQTVLYKIADIINSRPLSYISSDEVVESLTPNHFLKLGPTNINLSLEPVPRPIMSSTGSSLIQKWESLSGVLDAYWDAFRHLYLLALRERHTTHHRGQKGASIFQPKVGDIVLVQETTMPRSYWKLGRIIKLDKRQAVAHVFSNKQTLIRSIRNLYPLEVQCEQPVNTK